MELPLFLEILRNYYVDNPITASMAFAVVTTLCVIAYDVVNNLMSKSKAPVVKELNIYPIKSCAEIRVAGQAVTPRGFQNDRVFQVVSKVDGKWCFCTPRDKRYVKLFHLKPLIYADKEGIKLKLSSPHRKGNFILYLEDAVVSPIVCTVLHVGPREEKTLVDYGDNVAKWIQEATDIDDARLVSIPPGDAFRHNVVVNPKQGDPLPPGGNFPLSLADEAPFLLTTVESLADLNKKLKTSGKDEVDMRRFRPNIVIEGLEPWEEDSLKRIRIGSVEFHVWQRCGRCAMTTIDRDTLKRGGGEPLKTLGTFREREHGQRNFGMHLIPVMGGSPDDMGVVIGDEVEVLEYDAGRRNEWMASRMQIFQGRPNAPGNAPGTRSQPMMPKPKPKKSWRERMKECPFKDNL